MNKINNILVYEIITTHNVPNATTSIIHSIIVKENPESRVTWLKRAEAMAGGL